MNKLLTILLLSLFTIMKPYAQAIEIIDKPIIFNEERKELSLQYIEQHYGIKQDSAFITPKVIVIHWTVIPTMEKTFEVFNTPKLATHREAIIDASSLNVSAHFLVDRDGTIYRLMPEHYFARHVIGLNHCAIGIENVADGNDLPLTKAQFEANKKLVEYLTNKHPIEYLIGHDQYKQFIGTPLWKELDPNYLTEKSDVGEVFINRLHSQISPKLKPAPGL